MNASGARSDGLIEFDDDYFGDPEVAHERLRAAGPIHRAVLSSGDEVWLLVGHEQVRAALTDPRLSVDRRHAGSGYTGLSLPGALNRNLLSLDGADHARLGDWPRPRSPARPSHRSSRASGPPRRNCSRPWRRPARAI